MIEIDDPYYGLSEDVSCALPDLRYVLALVAGAVVVALALGAWAIRKMRLW